LSGERVERRLAAILAADVAGYSRLMGHDEAGTLARLKALCRELIDPKVAEHKGRIVKTTGDGLLIEFPSVVEAVACALAVQQGMARHNAGTAQDQRIDFRIGINSGDVIVEDGDIHGDGVNIAARLEALAEPGMICVSAMVQSQVEGRLDCGFEDLGEQNLKNIIRPVRVYRVRPALTRLAPSPLGTLSRIAGEGGPGALATGWVRVTRRRYRSPTSRRSRSCRSRTCRATPSRNISPTAWSRRSSPPSPASAGCS
jgi:class 3 adenylate cyclase